MYTPRAASAQLIPSAAWVVANPDYFEDWMAFDPHFSRALRRAERKVKEARKGDEKLGADPAIPTHVDVQTRRKSGRKCVPIEREFIFRTKSYAGAAGAAPDLLSLIKEERSRNSSALLRETTDRDGIEERDRLSEMDDAADDLLSWMDGTPRPWRDTTELAKLTYYSRAMKRRGVPVPYTLRLDPKKIDWRDPLTSIRKKLAYHLKGRSFAAIAEFTKTGELHLHGHIEARDASERKEIEAALHKVAKGWREGRGKARAVSTAEDARVDGWSCYSTKSISETKAEFDRRRRELQVNSKRSPEITIKSDDLRREAEELYEDHRRRLGARRCSMRRIQENLKRPYQPHKLHLVQRKTRSISYLGPSPRRKNYVNCSGPRCFRRQAFEAAGARGGGVGAVCGVGGGAVAVARVV